MTSTGRDNIEDLFVRIRETLAVDPSNLDRDIAQIPSQLMDCSEVLAVLAAEQDRAKADYDLAQATEADRLRNLIDDDDDEGSDKRKAPKRRSEAQISSEVVLAPAVRKALQKLDDAKFNQARWRALVDALRSKSKSLEMIGDLIKAGYMTPDTIYRQARQQQPARSVPQRRGVAG